MSTSIGFKNLKYHLNDGKKEKIIKWKIQNV